MIKIYKYKANIPYSQNSSYPYMTGTLQMFTPINKGDNIAVINNGMLYNVYDVKSGRLIYTTNERSIKILISKCDELSNLHNSDTATSLQYHISRIFTYIKHRAKSTFFSSKSKSYNRHLIQNNADMYTKVKRISSGELFDNLKDVLAIAAITRPLSEFKKLVKKIRSRIDTYVDYVESYLNGFAAFNLTYRSSSKKFA